MAERVFTVIMIRIFEQLVCCSIQSTSPRGLHMFDNFSSVFCIHKESDEYTLRLMTYYSQRSDDGNVFCVHNEGENERKSHKYTNCMLKGLNLKCNIPAERSRRRRKKFPRDENRRRIKNPLTTTNFGPSSFEFKWSINRRLTFRVCAPTPMFE